MKTFLLSLFLATTFLLFYSGTIETAPVDCDCSKVENIESEVLICNSSSSYAYHSGYCSGLKRCKAGVSKLSQQAAINKGRTACKICYK